MKRVHGLAVLVVLSALQVLPEGVAGAEQPAGGQPASGRIYDIDYLSKQGWTQLLLKEVGSGTSLAVVTRSALLQAVLETSMAMAVDAEIAYASGNPANLISARVSAPTRRQDPGSVEWVECVETGNVCTAKVVGQVEAKTNNARALGVLLAAMKQGRVVEYLQVDAQTADLVRVKVNVP